MRLRRTSHPTTNGAQSSPVASATAFEPAPVRPARLLNSWAVVPMRIFLGSLFLFAGYAMLTYPGFLDAKSGFGINESLKAVKPGSPIGPALQPFIDHASILGHVTAYAELAIGLGLVLGALARIAAVAAIVLTTLIVLTVHWQNVRQYTGQSGWFTSVDIAIAVALTVFVLGGAGPLSVDRGLKALAARRDAHDDAEPGFRDNEAAESRSRLQGEPTVDTGQPTVTFPAQPQPYPAESNPTQSFATDSSATRSHAAGPAFDSRYDEPGVRSDYPAELPTSSFYPSGERTSSTATDHLPEDPRGDVTGSLWTEGRRADPS